MIIIKERAYFELTPDIAIRLARYVLRQRSRQLKIKEKMGYNYLKISYSLIYEVCTGKSLSEAFIFAEHGENMLCT